MTRTPITFAAALIVVLSLVGCSRSTKPSSSNAQLPRPSEMDSAGDGLFERTSDGELLDLGADELVERKRLAYVECKEHEAETVLVMRITIPKVMSRREHRLPLRIKQVGEFHDYGISSYFEDGLDTDGNMFGCGCSIWLRDTTNVTVNVDVHVHWTAEDRSSGSFDKSLPITIRKPSSKELDGGISIEWEFEDPIVAGN